MKFWNIKNEPEGAELRIDGDIVDDSDMWLYEWFDMAATAPNDFREQMKEVKGKPLTVWIDSYGGNVFAAAGIYNALKEHDAKVTVKIDSKAMSAASVIAMAGDEILMSPVSIMMIHNPLTEVMGYASDLRKAADVLDEVKETIINAYQLKTGKSRNKISELMDEESYMSAKTAIKEGFADDMLYLEEKEDTTYNFAFKRCLVLNSTSEAVKRMIDEEKTKENNEIFKAKLALALEC